MLTVFTLCLLSISYMHAETRHLIKEVNKTKPFTILVEGNVACGKSTFLKHFKKLDNITVLPEPVELWRNVSGWDLKELKYRDPAKWGMAFQSYVTLTMLDRHRTPVTTPVKMMERSLFSGRIVFTEYNRRIGILHPVEFAVIDEWFKFIHRELPVDVDLIVYLRTTPFVAYERGMNRDQSTRERTLSYMEDIHQLHEDWLVHKTIGELPAPVLILNGDLGESHIIEEFNRNIHQILRQVADATSPDHSLRV